MKPDCLQNASDKNDSPNLSCSLIKKIVVCKLFAQKSFVYFDLFLWYVNYGKLFNANSSESACLTSI